MYLLGQKHLSASEKQSKFIFERVSLVEKHFSEVCASLSAYTRKAARVRDKGDELAKSFQNYAMSEKINISLSKGLLNFSRALSLLSDHRDTEVIRLDTKVIQELANYDSFCRTAKDELKHSLNARDKEISKKRNLDKILEKSPANKQQIALAEHDLSKCSMEVLKTIRNLEKQTETFEKQKIRDVKSVLIDFIQIEMSLHAKALEILTAAYQDISNIDEQSDFQVYFYIVHTIIQEFQKLSRSLDREFCKSMKIQSCENSNDCSTSKTNYNSKRSQRPQTSQSMGDLFFSRGLDNQYDLEDRYEVDKGNANRSMESISLGRSHKRLNSEGISNGDYEYELNNEDTDEDSSDQASSLYNYK